MPVVLNRNVGSHLGLVNGKEGKIVVVYFSVDCHITRIVDKVWLVDKPPLVLLVRFRNQMKH